MLKVILGVLDMLAALALVFLKFKPSLYLGFIFGFYLIFKGVIFLSGLSFASVLDIITGMVIITAGYGYYTIFNFLFVIWLVQKGYVSLVT